MNDFERQIIIDFVKDLLKRERDEFPEFSINTTSKEFQGILHILNVDIDFFNRLIFEEIQVEKLLRKAEEEELEAARNGAKATMQFLRGMYPEVYNHFEKGEEK